MYELNLDFDPTTVGFDPREITNNGDGTYTVTRRFVHAYHRHSVGNAVYDVEAYCPCPTDNVEILCWQIQIRTILIRKGVSKRTKSSSDGARRRRRNPNDSSKIADMTVVNAIVNDSKKAVETYNKIQELSTLREELSSLNAARGGGQGLKGFIMESLEANAQRQAGPRAIVIDDNGIADLVINNGGKAQTVQIKCGYKPGQIDFSKYKDAGVDRFMLNRDHPQFEKIAEEARQHGYTLEPTQHSAAECQMISDGMQLEYKITGNPKTFFVPHAYTTQQAFDLIAQRGVAGATAAAKFGGALAVGVGVVEVLSGNKSVEDAAKDAFNTTADAAFYGAAGNMVMSTAPVPIVTTSIASVANGIAGTAIGTKMLVAGTTVVDAASAASAAGAIFFCRRRDCHGGGGG